MNIKIVDSWLREFLKTNAKPSEIAKELSLRSVSVDRVEKVGEDFVYDIEVTTNRPDLMSVKQIAKEATISLTIEGTEAKYKEDKNPEIPKSANEFPIKIKSDPKLVNRICAVVLEVEVAQSPKEISQRLELSGIRSLNNLIDVTNYVMRETGHPTHVFDLDLLTSKEMIIREAKAGEKIVTLDNKEYELLGGDIVADDGSGKIIDLLGVMGTKNSVVNENTKRILFFLDNNNPVNIRKTSMGLGIRTEAAIINEKGIDPELMMEALKKGVGLYEKIANGKVISKVFDYYPNKPEVRRVNVNLNKISDLIGIEINEKNSVEILEKLGFGVVKKTDSLQVTTPTNRPDVVIEEDVIEEIARIYGYHKIQPVIPSFLPNKKVPYANNFYFEKRVKEALKYWGFTEVYTYSMVSQDLYEGPVENAISLKNPLTQDLAVLRNSLIPSLLQVVKENTKEDILKIFEIANTYTKKPNDLPDEILTIAGVIKQKNANFYEIKGVVETLLLDIGIKNLAFKTSKNGGLGASVYANKDYLGEIEVLDESIVDFELNFTKILSFANLSKTYKNINKFPPIIQDISLITEASTQEIINLIKDQSNLIAAIDLIDTFENSRTFRITYLDTENNLTKEKVGLTRDKMLKELKEKLSAEVKE